MAKKHVATSREYSSNSKANAYIAGILLIILGAVIVYCGAGMINTVVLATGILMIIFGIMTFAQYKVIEACLIQVILGIILIVLGYYGLAAEIVQIIVGIMIILAGLGIILGTRNQFFIFTVNTNNAVIQYSFGILVIILGVFALINYYDCFGWIIRIVGALIAIAGILAVCKTAGIIKK